MAPGDSLTNPDRFFGCLSISAPQGRSGKTIITIALCDIFKRRGLSVQPFKKGPDYIDPSWLTIAARRSCRNLDPFLIPEDRLIQAFEQACEDTDLALVEGAMGLYDGLDDRKTTAEIAHLLNLPILLVVNTSRMTGSIAAMVKGYQLFRTDITIAGVILNHVSGLGHEEKLRNAVEQHCGIPVVGSIPRDADFLIAERHLGLIPAPESEESKLVVERIGHRLEPCFDIDKILSIAYGTVKACSTSSLPLRFCGKSVHGSTSSPRTDYGTLKINYLAVRPEPFDSPFALSLSKGERFAQDRHVEGGTVNCDTVSLGERDGVRGSQTSIAKIGVLCDRVFNFYYPENFEALKEAGAQLLFIDSLTDRLPELDGLYIGGGFPEFFLKELERNDGLRKDIAGAVERGLPVYAECAGLMYLCRSIRWQGRSYEMAGVISAEVELSPKPEGHGYVIAKVVGENGLFPVGFTVRGHEFHHSTLFHLNGFRFAYQIVRGRGITGREDGILYKNLFASYLHLHALGTPEWAKGFVALACKERNRVGY
jgi:cobyrinic acid a,c-diamide synthase